jgi:hypothetical protein
MDEAGPAQESPEKPGLPSTREELSELVRGIVRDEMDAREARKP